MLFLRQSLHLYKIAFSTPKLPIFLSTCAPHPYSLAKGNLRLQRRNSNSKSLSRRQWILKVHRKRVPTLDSSKLHDVILSVTFAQLEVLHASHFDTSTKI